MTLKALIIAAGVNKTASELTDELNALSILKTDNALYTYAGIVDKLGMEIGLAFRSTIMYLGDIANPAELPTQLHIPLNFAHERFSGGGLDISRTDVQMVLDALVNIPALAEFVPAIKAIGRWYISPATNAGLDTLSPQEVEAALAEVLLDAQKATLEDAAIDALQTFREELSAWDGSGNPPVLGGA